MHKKRTPFFRSGVVIWRAAEEFDSTVAVFDESRIAESCDQFRFVLFEPSELIEFHDDWDMLDTNSQARVSMFQGLTRRGRRAGNQYSSGSEGTLMITQFWITGPDDTPFESLRSLRGEETPDGAV